MTPNSFVVLDRACGGKSAILGRPRGQICGVLAPTKQRPLRQVGPGISLLSRVRKVLVPRESEDQASRPGQNIPGNKKEQFSGAAC
jgi:hypothetical protein